MCTGGCNLFYLFLGEPDHVYQHALRAKQANAFRKINQREMIFTRDESAIGLNFSQVHRNMHIALTSIIAHLTIQFGGNTTRSTCTKPDMNAIIGLTMPFIMRCQDTEKAGFSGFDHPRMHYQPFRGIRSCIHYDTSKTGANTALFYRLSNAVKAVTMGQHCLKKGGGART